MLSTLSNDKYIVLKYYSNNFKGAVTWGIRVVNRLLKGAQPLPSDNVYRNFVKPGGWDRALKDFQTAMRDTDVQTSKMPKKVCFNCCRNLNR